MLLRLNTIGAEAIESLAPSFNNLPETNHLDGKYRLRRYSAVRCNGKCIDTGVDTFEQSSEYNKFQGDMSRKFEPIEKNIIESDAILQICSEFNYICGFPEKQKIDIHQMRVITLEDETPVSPEGVHQDGYDYIAVIGVSRYNIEGGEFLSYMNKNDKKPFMSVPLNPGLMVILNDRELWHNASKIKAVIGKHGYMDSFILTAKMFD